MTEPNDIPAILARSDAATEGPWEWGNDGCNNALMGGPDGSVRVHSDGSACDEYSPDIDIYGEDALFIAHSRTDVPNMAAEILSLRAQLADRDSHDRRSLEMYRDTRFVEISRMSAEQLDADALDRKRLDVLEEMGCDGHFDTLSERTLREAADAELSRREKENG